MFLSILPVETAAGPSLEKVRKFFLTVKMAAKQSLVVLFALVILITLTMEDDFILSQLQLKMVRNQNLQGWLSKPDD
jgi:hypothetical protein